MQQTDQSNQKTSDEQALVDAIARNVRAFRGAQAWSLDELSAQSGVSKGMLVQIEQGRTNPSVGTLGRVANALGLDFTRLFETDTAPVRITKADDIVTLWRGDKKSAGRFLSASARKELVEFWDWSLSPGDRRDSGAHPEGTHEVVYILEGTLTVEIDGETHEAHKGDLMTFISEKPHAYVNKGRGVARFVMVVGAQTHVPDE